MVREQWMAVVSRNWRVEEIDEARWGKFEQGVSDDEFQVGMKK